MTNKPRIGISACLLGNQVRFDGGHKRDAFLTGIFGRFVEWFPVCPEVEVGMTVPREPVRLMANMANPRMLGERSGKDWTEAMHAFARRRIDQLENLELSGYIFKKNSPSCGFERVRIYNSKGVPTRQGRGLFAETRRRPVAAHARGRRRASTGPSFAGKFYRADFCLSSLANTKEEPISARTDQVSHRP